MLWLDCDRTESTRLRADVTADTLGSLGYSINVPTANSAHVCVTWHPSDGQIDSKYLFSALSPKDSARFFSAFL